MAERREAREEKKGEMETEQVGAAVRERTGGRSAAQQQRG
jgi:hypothetical protein